MKLVLAGDEGSAGGDIESAETTDLDEVEDMLLHTAKSPCDLADVEVHAAGEKGVSLNGDEGQFILARDCGGSALRHWSCPPRRNGRNVESMKEVPLLLRHAIEPVVTRMAEAGWVERSFFDGERLEVKWTEEGKRVRAALEELLTAFPDGLGSQEAYVVQYVLRE
jgi:hypothetical protein